MNNDEASNKNIVPNAGIVLISSFFPVLFERLGLLNKSKSDFKDIESKICAIFAIQYLVKKKIDNVDSNDLLLNGIFVEYPFASSLSTDYSLHDEEIKVLEQLLQDVKLCWKKIQNTSVVGMQYSFFVRNGSLEEKSDKWVLNVEKSPFDMLIKYIPFDFHKIDYPWMKKPIEVIW